MSELINEQYQEIYQNLEAAETRNSMVFFETMKPTLSLDGNSWCCLFGKDLQVGIAGFGDSPLNAIIDFNKAMVKTVK